MTNTPSRTFRCPCCGERDEAEFRYGGDPQVSRPEFTATNAQWAAYLYTRENPQGVSREYWIHTKGCGTWLIIERDTVTHAILTVLEATS